MKTLKCNACLFAVFLIISTSGQNQSLIYILLWIDLPDFSWTYWYLEMGQEAFVSRNCSFQNCYITSNRLYFENVLYFDVILFNAVHSSLFKPLPLNRSEVQLYVFVSGEPALYYPIPTFFDDFFNLTWTYKLQSDIVHPYFVIKNEFGNIIGPKFNMHWRNISNLPPRNTFVEQKLLRKHIAATCVVSNCASKSRLIFIDRLRYELSKYGHQIDVYGECGSLSCPIIARERRGLLSSCYAKIESDYYFYLAFENSNSEDYVTEKVLHGLLHFAVPIVYGGANYTRYLPGGTYLNALKLGEERLAKEMNDIINDPPRYFDFFKWHGYYSFHDTAIEGNDYSVCEFCAFLNDDKRRYKKTVYKYISYWWNPPYTDIRQEDT